MTEAKKNYQAEEIGKLRAALEHRDKSVAHYRELVAKHSKTLHRQARALKRLRRAAQALLDENEEVARASYTNSGREWSDDIWRAEDPDNARLCIQLRSALQQ